MKIYYQGDVEKILGISRYTLVKLEREGKIPKAKRQANGYRYYFLEDIEKIAEIYFGDGYSKILKDRIKD